MWENYYNMFRWYKIHPLRKPIRLSEDEIKDIIIILGNWLKDQKYLGIDVTITNPPKEMSTVYSFSLIGWINLYKLYGTKSFLDEAKYCLNRILTEQRPNGEWLFPYKFRRNPAYFPYACENFMTIKSLFTYLNEINQRNDITNSIKKNLDFLINYIGHDEGVFWYSPTDKIKVLNISSMAANIFTKAYVLFNDVNYLKKANIFANYCIANQTIDGAFPYFEGISLVYIPYHALEIWELKEANTILNNKKIETSLEKGIKYLTNYFNEHSYSSYNQHRKYNTIMFKTPLWYAKAYLTMNDYSSALKHFTNAIYLFQVPKKPYFFNYIKYLLLKENITPSYLILSSIFMRYNASCFKIGSQLLLNSIDFS